MFLKCLQYYQTDLSHGKTRGKHGNMMHLYVYTGRNCYIFIYCQHWKMVLYWHHRCFRDSSGHPCQTNNKALKKKSCCSILTQILTKQFSCLNQDEYLWWSTLKIKHMASKVNNERVIWHTNTNVIPMKITDSMMHSNYSVCCVEKGDMINSVERNDNTN